MRTKLLNFLALLGAVHGRILPTSECTTQAWVRAPDLVPNTIVQGDARVKINAECPAVDNVSLGLRFKERSFVKALRSREDVKWLSHGPSEGDDFWTASPWQLRFQNQSIQEAREQVLSNKDRWIVREEERIVFETRQPFDIGVQNNGVLRDTVQDFAILVPSTNFPPGLQASNFGVPKEHEIVDVEWIYEYFTQISFSNGTTIDTPAGFTSFQPLRDPAAAIQGPTLMTIGLDLPRNEQEKLAEDAYIAHYSVEINSNLMFIAGTKGHTLDATVSRTGLARTFSVPLTLLVCIAPKSSMKWVIEYDLSDDHIHVGRLPYVLRTTLGADQQATSKRGRPVCSSHRSITVEMPNSTSEEIQANKIVTTTSTVFAIPIELQDTHLANFETYYQTDSNALLVTLKTPLEEDKETNPDGPFGERGIGIARSGQRFDDDDDKEWIPWDKMTTFAMPYSARVPVVVHPADEVTLPQHCLLPSTTVPDQVILPHGTGCEPLPLTHYLDEGARAPTFVDRSAIRALLKQDPVARDLHAPILEPVVSSPPMGEELVYRYYRNHSLRKWDVYVGETWAKNVVNKHH